MTQYSYRIVGAYYRQKEGTSPAETLLRILPKDTKLIVRADPKNPVDPHAIAISISTSEIAYRIGANDSLRIRLAESLTRTKNDDWTIDRMLEAAELPLGFIPAAAAKDMDIGSADIDGTLSFGLDGIPKVTFNTAQQPSTDPLCCWTTTCSGTQ